MDEREYSLMEHLSDLRGRLGKAVIGVAIVGMAAFLVSNELLMILRVPLEEAIAEANRQLREDNKAIIEAKFIVTSATEYLVCQMKAALVAGLFIASPWVLFQIWSFISPGLYDHEKRYVTWFVTAGAICFCAGAVFAYFAVFPTMFVFLVKNTPPDIFQTYKIEDHFGLALKMLVAFGAIFETPVVIFILSIAGIVDPNQLGKYRKYVLVAAFVIGAILTPSPDVMSQALMAGPLMILYELGVFVSRMTIKVTGTKMTRKERAEQYEKEKAEKAAKSAPKADDDVEKKDGT